MSQLLTTEWRRRGLISVIALALSMLIAVPTAHADDHGNRGCNGRNDSYDQLLLCVTVDNVLDHEERFQRIADRNDGTRASGTPGYDQSVRYIVRELERARYDVTVQEFPFDFFQELSPPTLDQVSPDPTVYEPNVEVFTMTYSGSGDVTAPVQAVDVQIPPPAEPGSTSGCEEADFAGFVAGNVALIQRGTCTFGQKALNAQNAGAVGVIIFNEGQEGRTDAFSGTLGSADFTIPVVGVSFATGADLADPAGTVVHLATSTLSEERTTYNVVAESQGGNDDNVVMAGAHLDSVVAGPGINDNGSGSAALLEVALQMAEVEPVNTLRFAWWGAEELGLVGSEYYVSQLSPEELERIALYLNYDMVGSPNYVRFIYDGDQSTFPAPVPVPEGSAQIEAVYDRFFAYRGLPAEDTEFSGRSDYQAFILAGVPAGGLFTGAEGIKTEEQAAIYGGTAGEQYDPCYHQACDNIGENFNLDLQVLSQNSDAIAYAMLTFGYSTEVVNGVAGEPVPEDDVRDEDRHDDGLRVQASGTAQQKGEALAD